MSYPMATHNNAHQPLIDARHEAPLLIQALSIHALRFECARAEGNRVAALERSEEPQIR